MGKLTVKRKLRQTPRRHGHAKHGDVSAEYNVWHGMINRCSQPKNKNWRRYGGRGIQVCERWQVFENFLADMGKRPTGLQLDRLNNDGNYEPNNCRWVSARSNSQNRRSSVVLTIQGSTRCVAEWSRVSGIPAAYISARLKLGWSAREAVWRKPMKAQPGINVGSKHGLAKLNENSVRDIRARFATGQTQRSIAKIHDISFSTVSLICLRQRWKHVA